MCKTSFEVKAQTLGHISILRSIGGGIFDGDLVERLLVLAFAHNLRKRNGFMVEGAFGHIIHAVVFCPTIKDIGHQHGVIDRCEGCSVLLQDHQIIFKVVAHFHDRRICEDFSQGFQNIAGFQLRALIISIKGKSIRPVKKWDIARITRRRAKG